MTEGKELRRDITTRGISLRAASVDEHARTVEAVLTTEAPVAVFDPWEGRMVDEVLIARSVSIPERIPLLANHDRSSIDQVLGSIRDMRIEPDPPVGESIVGRLHFAAGDADSERAWNKVRQGHITDVSIGYRVDEAVEIKPGASAIVGGRSYLAGQRAMRVVTKWTAREGSLVPIGADERAKVRETSNTKGPPMDHEGNGADTAPANAGAVSAMGGGPAANSNQVNPVDTAEVERRAVASERARVAAIRSIAPRGIDDSVVERAISDGLTREQAAIVFLEQHRSSFAEPVASAPGAIVRDHERDCSADVVMAALALRTGGGGLDHVSRLAPVCRLVGDDRQRAAAKLAERADRFRKMSMADVARESVRLAGGDAMLGYSVEEVWREAIRLDAMQISTRASSTGMLTGIFTSVAGAVLLASYEAQPSTVEGWTSVGDLPDFKLTDRPRIANQGGMRAVARGKEARHASYTDANEQYRIHRFAEQWSMDEQDIIDDSVNGLQAIPQNMGSRAADVVPDLVYSILLANAALISDSIALFHASHSNLVSGSDTALSSTSARVGISSMLKQTENGRVLNIMAGYCLVPPDLKFTARQIFQSAQVAPTGVLAGSQSDLGTDNPLREEGVIVRAEGRIGVAGATDPVTGTTYAGTATNWFLAAKGAKHTIEVGYLRGQRTPTMRSEPMTIGRWGIKFDVKFDAGAKAMDFRGLYKSAGA